MKENITAEASRRRGRCTPASGHGCLPGYKGILSCASATLDGAAIHRAIESGMIDGGGQVSGRPSGVNQWPRQASFRRTTESRATRSEMLAAGKRRAQAAGQ
jgi:hypothetical protein